MTPAEALEQRLDLDRWSVRSDGDGAAYAADDVDGDPSRELAISDQYGHADEWYASIHGPNLERWPDGEIFDLIEGRGFDDLEAASDWVVEQARAEATA